MVGSMPADRGGCVDQWWSLLLWSSTSGGQEFSFMAARAGLGHLVELYEPSERLLAFYAKVAPAAHTPETRE